MIHRISSTDLVRGLGDVLGRIRYLGDSFIVERNGEPVARIDPIAGVSPVTVREALAAWGEGAHTDPDFAQDLERAHAADLPPDDPWAS